MGFLHFLFFEFSRQRENSKNDNIRGNDGRAYGRGENDGQHKSGKGAQHRHDRGARDNGAKALKYAHGRQRGENNKRRYQK